MLAYPSDILYTPEEYLERERAAVNKSEYLAGTIYAMSGSSPEHSAITANLTIALGVQFRGKPCRVFSNDLKVRSSPSGLYAYPDLSIVCGEPEFHDDKRDVLTNPSVIIEVLSPSTEDYDRGRKFVQYQHIAALTDYLLVAQDTPRVDHFSRQSESHWLLTTAIGLDAQIAIASIGCVLYLREVYDRIAFE